MQFAAHHQPRHPVAPSVWSWRLSALRQEVESMAVVSDEQMLALRRELRRFASQNDSESVAVRSELEAIIEIALLKAPRSRRKSNPALPHTLPPARPFIAEDLGTNWDAAVQLMHR